MSETFVTFPGIDIYDAPSQKDIVWVEAPKTLDQLPIISQIGPNAEGQLVEEIFIKDNVPNIDQPVNDDAVEESEWIYEMDQDGQPFLSNTSITFEDSDEDGEVMDVRRKFYLNNPADIKELEYHGIKL